MNDSEELDLRIDVSNIDDHTKSIDDLLNDTLYDSESKGYVLFEIRDLLKQILKKLDEQ